MIFKRKEKQHYQDDKYEEEDYQELKKIILPIYKLTKDLESLYSVRSLNKIFERIEKEAEESIK